MSDETKTAVPTTPKQSLTCNMYWYIPIAIVILLGFGVGGILAFGTEFLGLFTSVTDPQGRLALTLYGVGILGASSYLSAFFARDANATFKRQDGPWPNFLDPFGYVFVLLGGGITGLLFVLAVRLGFVAAYNGGNTAEMRLPALVILAYGGGFASSTVKRFFARLVKELAEKRSGPLANSGPVPSATSPTSGTPIAGDGASGTTVPVDQHSTH